MTMTPPSPKKPETILRGIPASPGIAVGVALTYLKEIPQVERWTVDRAQIEPECERLERALQKSIKELQKILVFAQQKVGEAKAKVLEAQILMLEDPVLIAAIHKRIRGEQINAEYIVSDEIGKYARLMLQAPDEYMHERAHDVEDLKNRIIRNLQQEKLVSRLEGSVIVVAHTLTPADTMILSRNHVLGYATDLGGITSHAALFSRSLKIPAVVGLGDVSREVVSGDLLILDGYGGTLVISPTEERIREYEEKRDRFAKFERELEGLKDLPAVSTDGHNVELSANVELTDELEYVVLQGSQGVGLFRTESLLIGRDDFPSEEEQYQEYKRSADRIYPQRVIMRTFDIGGDKIAPDMAEEANPFLGWRGVRVCLDRPDLFNTQLRAMLRASTRKNLAIMFPMVTTVQEVRRAKEFVRKAKEDLRAEKIKFDERIRLGVMIEVPAAALSARLIAKEVSFLSIGSNDLIQYLLAVDRGNNLVSSLYREFDPSVLAVINDVIRAAHEAGIWVGLCGEMAAHPLATSLLVGMGMDELSVVPVALPKIKKIIRKLKYLQMQKMAATVLRMTTADEVEKYLTTFMRKEFPEFPIDSAKG